MYLRKRLVLIALGIAIALPAVLSCQLEALDGQLSCAESPCPEGMYCHRSNQRCYSSDKDPFADPDASIGTDATNDTDTTGDTDSAGDHDTGGETDSDSGGDTDTADTGIDACPDDDQKIVPGQCGCGVEDIDSDNDGVADCNDICVSDPKKTQPGLCGCGTPENKCEILCVEERDHDVATLNCRNAGTIESIVFASFGAPVGSCDGQEPGVGKCKAKDAVSVIEDACLGKSLCKVKVDKKVLGSPHCDKGVQRKLIVEYSCVYSK